METESDVVMLKEGFRFPSVDWVIYFVVVVCPALPSAAMAWMYAISQTKKSEVGKC